MTTTRYQAELDKLSATYKAAMRVDVSRLKHAIAGASESSLIGVGSGGSFTVASLLCKLHESYTGRVSRASTPLEIICNPTLASSSPVFLISAEGKNPDITEALKRARHHSARPIHVLTNRDASPLMEAVSQLEQIMKSTSIPSEAEICPVLPHPSRDPRRADRLLVEYKAPLFDSRRTPTSNILYVHESHPFEAYRQLLGALTRYRDSMLVLGGCRLVVTPFGSKLITLGAGLACFEMRPQDLGAHYGVSIPHAEPTRYVVSANAVKNSRPEICALLLTGSAYA